MTEHDDQSVMDATGEETGQQSGDDLRREPQPGPGERLRSAREALGLTVDELMAQTKLTRQSLEALERDDFAVLNEPVYVRGYYRKCAKVLDLDEAELLAAYDIAAGHPMPKVPTYRVPRERDARVPHHWMPWLVYGAIAAALIALLLWLFGGSTPADVATAGSSLAAQSSEQQTPAAEFSGSDFGAAAGMSSKPGTGSQSAGQPSNPAIGGSRERSVASIAEDSATSAADAEEGGQVVVATGTVSDSGVLAMQFTSTSWIRVEDDNGKRLLTGLVSEGERSVSGTPPYTVFLGYAPGVSMSIDGQPVNFSEYVRSNNTARFTVTVR